LSEVSKRLKESQISLEVTDSAKSEILAKGLDPAYGARPLRRAIQRMVEDVVTDMVLRRDVKAGDTVLVDAAPESGLLLTRKE
jgi:ATP-dependent Clp protease ATP-binding subunit ClpC